MEPYLGEIRLFTGDFAPPCWQVCDGSLLPIGGNEDLFAVVGTIYGGDGVTNFALPDIRGRAVIGAGNNFNLGQKAGAESIALTPANLPAHNHHVAIDIKLSDKAGTTASPKGSFWAPSNIDNDNEYALLPSTGSYMAADALEVEMGVSTSWRDSRPNKAEPFSNMQPFLAVNYMICIEGVYPTPG